MASIYFAYGSNMNFTQMCSRCPGSEFVSVAHLKGWSYFINGNGYAGIEEQEDAITHGCLWRLNEEHLRSLDHYEAVRAGYYSRVQMIVIKGLELVEQEAEIYISNNRTYGVPRKSYQMGIIQGASELGLPKGHIEFLKSWEDGNPHTRKSDCQNET